MIKLLVRFAAWLDARFPARLVVTQDLFDTLMADNAKRDAYCYSIAKQAEDQGFRLSKAEKSIDALKEAVGKTIAPAAISAEKRRADFIGSGRITD